MGYLIRFRLAASNAGGETALSSPPIEASKAATPDGRSSKIPSALLAKNQFYTKALSVRNMGSSFGIRGLERVIFELIVERAVFVGEMPTVVYI